MKTKQVTTPVLEFNYPDGTYIRLWAINPGEWVQLSPAKCHYFGAVATASLIYESNFIKIGGLHAAEEVDLRDKSTWDWIKSHMGE